MKIKQADYDKLKAAVFKVIDADPEILTRDVPFVHDMEESRRWRIYWRAKEINPLRFDYLKDSHIDTALRNILKEVA